ncbi:PstS family phosphate ABC transporter substrate-binding protein [Thermoflavifilum thermophilum]|uniref:Phosphate transport system substrate-binding protein n=1 Tax=Thermoflavifilum thermophilum TaxID=1393122 RepID=A0A1I7N0H6_9BACT|nr:substrate-binding domain-containing protein [Thermoflavifilum thermophilum]SFV28128.1 phosphate transport system substrate-binding protein [Thermoflavifilum thermophilum]
MYKAVPIIATMFVFSILQSGCRQSHTHHIRISGAFALYPLVVKWAEEYKKTHPDIQFDISAGGAGKGLTDVLTGAVDIGMFSRELTPEESGKGIWKVAIAKDAVLPTINAKNPLLHYILQKGLTKAQFQRIFLNSGTLTWQSVMDTPVSVPLHVYTRSDASGAAETWAKYLGVKQENLKGTGIYGDPGLADAVLKDVYGVGFNNAIYIYDLTTDKKREGLEVIPIDINNNGRIDADENFYDSFDHVLQAISEGKYPSPPARPLYFITKGKPDNRDILEFLKWVLTYGQSYVKSAGYVPLPEQSIQSSLQEFKQQ